MEDAGVILAVDDDEAILEVVQMVLQEEGYSVLVAIDGAQALDLLRETQPALILLDMRMPNVNGWQFAEEYRRLPSPHAPIVVMSAGRDAAMITAEIGANDHLAKPFDIDDLVKIVRRHLNGVG